MIGFKVKRKLEDNQSRIYLDVKKFVMSIPKGDWRCPSCDSRHKLTAKYSMEKIKFVLDFFDRKGWITKITVYGNKHLEVWR